MPGYVLMSPIAKMPGTLVWNFSVSTGSAFFSSAMFHWAIGPSFALGVGYTVVLYQVARWHRPPLGLVGLGAEIAIEGLVFLGLGWVLATTPGVRDSFRSRFGMLLTPASRLLDRLARPFRGARSGDETSGDEDEERAEVVPSSGGGTGRGGLGA